jgi:hypothetical protein
LQRIKALQNSKPKSKKPRKIAAEGEDKNEEILTGFVYDVDGERYLLRGRRGFPF